MTCVPKRRGVSSAAYTVDIYELAPHRDVRPGAGDAGGRGMRDGAPAVQQGNAIGETQRYGSGGVEEALCELGVAVVTAGLVVVVSGGIGGGRRGAHAATRATVRLLLLL